MCTCTEDIHPFLKDREALFAFRTELVQVGLVSPLTYMTEVIEHEGGFSLPMRTECPYDSVHGGACLDASLRAVFKGRIPMPGCVYRELRSRIRPSNK